MPSLARRSGQAGRQSACSAKFQRKRALLSRELQRHSVLCLNTGTFGSSRSALRLGGGGWRGNKGLLVGFDLIEVAIRPRKPSTFLRCGSISSLANEANTVTREATKSCFSFPGDLAEARSSGRRRAAPRPVGAVTQAARRRTEVHQGQSQSRLRWPRQSAALALMSTAVLLLTIIVKKAPSALCAAATHEGVTQLGTEANPLHAEPLSSFSQTVPAKKRLNLCPRRKRRHH